jgi:hypothetical protein
LLNSVFVGSIVEFRKLKNKKMPPKESFNEKFYNLPSIHYEDNINMLASAVINNGLNGNNGLNSVQEVTSDDSNKFNLDEIAANLALETIATDMSLDRKMQFLEFMNNYVGDPDPENRRGIQPELPNTTVKTLYGEVFNYSLPCLAVINPETGRVIAVSKDPYKDSKRGNCWRVVFYDTLAEDPEQTVSEYTINNVITNPQDTNDIITLDIVRPDSLQFVDYHLQFSLEKVDYSRDKNQPVTLTTNVPYGQKPIVSEYPVDLGLLCEKLNKGTTSEAPKLRRSVHKELGHIADLAA